MNRRSFFRHVVAGAGALWLPDVARVYSFPSVQTISTEEWIAAFQAILNQRIGELLARLPPGSYVSTFPKITQADIESRALRGVRITVPTSVQNFHVRATLTA